MRPPSPPSRPVPSTFFSRSPARHVSRNSPPRSQFCIMFIRAIRMVHPLLFFPGMYYILGAHNMYRTLGRHEHDPSSFRRTRWLRRPELRDIFLLWVDAGYLIVVDSKIFIRVVSTRRIAERGVSCPAVVSHTPNVDPGWIVGHVMEHREFLRHNLRYLPRTGRRV
jgi:hypothetical protein